MRGALGCTGMHGVCVCVCVCVCVYVCVGRGGAIQAQGHVCVASTGPAQPSAPSVCVVQVMYMLDGYGISHGLDWGRVLDASEYISAALGRPNGSRAAKALLARRADAAEAAAEAKAKEPKAAQAA